VKLLKLKANKEMVQQHLSQTSEKVITLRDVSNLAQIAMTSQPNDLEEIVHQLTDKYGADVDILTNNDHHLTGLLFQDVDMRKQLAAFPEVLCDKASLQWFFRTLLTKNRRMSSTRVFMTDKDLSERSVIRNIFPDATLLLSLFHPLRIFRREVTCEKMGITSGQRQLCLELLQRMAYAKSSDAY